MTDQEKGILTILGAGLAIFIVIASCMVVSQIYQTQQPVTRATQGSLAVEYILDASGSMNETLLDGTRKADAARQLLSDSLKTYRPETGLGLRVYGHRLPETPREPSCQDIELIAPLEPGYQGQMATWLQNGYQPQGMTPIATALQQAVTDFNVEPGRVNSIVLISDGQETCGGDPCQVVRDLETAGIRFSLHVIGLNVDEGTRAQLTCIAQAGGGVYQDANTSQELQTALEVVQQQVVQPQPILAVEPPTESPPTQAPPSTPIPIPATPSAPVPPSTNNGLFEGQIAYIGVDGNVYLIRGDTGGTSQVTFDATSTEHYYSPAFSRDGTSLIFNRLAVDNYYDGSGPLYLSDTTSLQTKPLLESIAHFAWLPDGTQVVYLQNQALNLLNPARMTSTKIAGEIDNFWVSPDGGMIATYTRLDPDLCNPGRIDLYDMASGMNTHQFLAGWINGWSPDGKWVMHTAGCAFGGVWLTNTQTGLDGTNDYFYTITWSPDGSLFAGGLGMVYSGKDAILLQKPDGTLVGEIPRWTEKLLWSPNGRSIAASALAPGNMVLIDPNTLSVQEINDTPSSKPLIWSPGGTSLLISNIPATPQDAPAELSIYNVDTKAIIFRGAYCAPTVCIPGGYTDAILGATWGRLP